MVDENEMSEGAVIKPAKKSRKHATHHVRVSSHTNHLIAIEEDPTADLHGPLKYFENYKEPGYHYHVMKESKVSYASNRLGYELVERDKFQEKYPEFGRGDKYTQYVCESSGTQEPMFLMRMPDEKWEKRLAAKQDKNRHIEQSMKMGDQGNGIYHKSDSTHVDTSPYANPYGIGK